MNNVFSLFLVRKEVDDVFKPILYASKIRGYYCYDFDDEEMTTQQTRRRDEKKRNMYNSDYDHCYCYCYYLIRQRCDVYNSFHFLPLSSFAFVTTTTTRLQSKNAQGEKLILIAYGVGVKKSKVNVMMTKYFVHKHENIWGCFF